MPSKAINQTSLYLSHRVWLVVFICIAMLAGSNDRAESLEAMISLNPSKIKSHTIRITKSDEVKLSNDSQTILYDVTIININSGKRMLSIEDLKPSASLNLAFDHTGTYLACYSQESKEDLTKSNFLKIDVVRLRSI